MTNIFSSELGHAAIRAYAAYKDPEFVQLAKDWWNWTWSWTVSDAAARSKTALGKNFLLPSSCSNYPIVGGTFMNTDPADGNILIGQTGLSSLLAEATSNQTYVDQATQSFSFLQNLLLNTTTMIPQYGIVLSASDPKSCSTTPPSSTLCSGVWIEGLATFSTVADESTKPDDQLISKSYIAAMSAQIWHSADGILRVPDGNRYHADVNFPRGLGTLYQRTENPNFKNDIENYMAVQYNAILDLSTIKGSDLYSFDWIGPPASTFDFESQINALGVLIPVIALPDTNSTSNPNITSTSSSTSISNATPNSSPTSASRSSSSNTTPVEGIVGGILGGVLVLAAIIAVLLWHRREKQFLPPIRGFDSQARDLHINRVTNSPHLLDLRGIHRSEGPQDFHIQPFTQQKYSDARSGSAVACKGWFQERADSEQMAQHEQQEDCQLLREMGSMLSLLDWQLARIQQRSTVGSESDEPPEYPRSVRSG
ncbi:hypothetical protein V5O48_010870 [Marasmius crinis-equi]|uniref:Mannan endo-1,6-alpha-mannosidase n=1 Tax=Marasmius crinis-equi TaxID=585013 RepID=A0ABR3F7B0_9AGAR